MKIENWPLENIRPYPSNPRKNDQAVQIVANSLKEFGWRQPITVDKDGVIIIGHTRLKAAQKLKLKEAPVHQALDLTPDQVKALRLMDNKSGEYAEWDNELLIPEIGELKQADYDLLLTGFNQSEIDEILNSFNDGQNTNDPDAVPEVVESICKTGDLWTLGEHRLLCGDSRKDEDVQRLMDGKKSKLLHADPPYGMGKEKEGVLNDNLYKKKLDEFQMEWWKCFRPYLEDNAGAYIWGNPEDLWRLWYNSGLKDSEPITFRNEITWDKSYGLGMESDQHRMYPTASERCLFFMLGEQGFNNNADNYWEGWEPIRKYLEEQRVKCGWDIPQMKRLVGHSDLSRDHWTSKSQWTFPTKKVYVKLQEGAKGQAFKKNYDAFEKDYEELKIEYDKIKQDFYGTRAYFNNTHDSMTDVWKYERVKGDERQGHPTPKPVEMIERIVKSSSQPGEIIAEPFLGSGPMIIACEKTNRRCFGMELAPNYCDVCIKRWENYTGKKAEKI